MHDHMAFNRSQAHLLAQQTTSATVHGSASEYVLCVDAMRPCDYLSMKVWLPLGYY